MKFFSKLIVFFTLIGASLLIAFKGINVFYEKYGKKHVDSTSDELADFNSFDSEDYI